MKTYAWVSTFRELPAETAIGRAIFTHSPLMKNGRLSYCIEPITMFNYNNLLVKKTLQHTLAYIQIGFFHDVITKCMLFLINISCRGHNKMAV